MYATFLFVLIRRVLNRVLLSLDLMVTLATPTWVFSTSELANGTDKKNFSTVTLIKKVTQEYLNAELAYIQCLHKKRIFEKSSVGYVREDFQEEQCCWCHNMCGVLKYKCTKVNALSWVIGAVICISLLLSTVQQIADYYLLFNLQKVDVCAPDVST